MSSLDQFLQKQLISRQEENRLRKLAINENLVDFFSNDYLGLARSQDLFDLINKKVESIQPRLNGATGSRLLSGNYQYTEEVENKLARIFKAEAALIFNSGYSANLSVLSSIPQRGDTILYDELAHACIKDGARLSMASRFSFRHNDLNDLEKKLKLAKGKIFIAVESIYSMDGDQCPLSELVLLSKRYDASIILDEAHSTGVIGEDGSGLAVSKQIQNEIAIRIYTFGKAMGIHGACIAGSKKLIDYLINFSRPFIYTTALPAHSVASIECSFDYLKLNIHLREGLKDKIKLFLSNTNQIKSRTSSITAIQTVVIPGNKEAKQAAEKIQLNGLDVRPILSPTVSEGKERLRICLHTFNSTEEINQLSSIIKHLN